MYLYDETPDDALLKLWEWPRSTPSESFFRGNGHCEDGHPAVNASIPQGNYSISFGSGDCASMYVNISTALVSGCGKIAIVPCQLGTDCLDCGRSASHAALDHAHDDDDDDGHSHRRKLQTQTEDSDSHHSMPLPALDDQKELLHLLKVAASASHFALPAPYSELVQRMR